MSVGNLDNIINSLNPNVRKVEANNHALFPQHTENQSFRWLVSGESGSGKTNLVLSAILPPQFRNSESPDDAIQIKFDKLYLYTKTPEQPKYKLLFQWINTMESEFEQAYGEKLDMVTIRTKPEEVISVDDMDSDIINLCIIDDMITVKNQEVFEDMFIRGRHRNLSCIYITQSYFKTPIDIRKQCNYISLFGVNSLGDLVTLCKEHSLLREYDEFKKMFREACVKKTDFFLIDRRTDIELLKHRKNWDEVWYDDKWTPIANLQ